MLKLSYFLVLFLSFLNHNPLSAYEKDDYQKLFTSLECKKCNLYRANLSGLDLTGMNLEGANLKYANLKKSTLFRVNLKGAKIEGAKFEGALWVNGQYICQKGSIGRCISEKGDEAESK